MNRIPKILLSTILAAILLLGFAVPVNMVGNWYQQFMPNLNGRQINDITFVDSLVGYAITNSNRQNDTAFILKTSDGGDNWSKIYFRTTQIHLIQVQESNLKCQNPVLQNLMFLI